MRLRLDSGSRLPRFARNDSAGMTVPRLAGGRVNAPC